MHRYLLIYTVYKKLLIIVKHFRVIKLSGIPDELALEHANSVWEMDFVVL